MPNRRNPKSAPGSQACEGSTSPRSRKSVAILFSERDDPERYVVSRLAAYWRAEGLVVHYLLGTRRHVPADALLIHVDLSVLPESVLDFASRYPRVLNQHMRDIRKRSFSALLLERESDYAGPVIVKTDLNFGGGPEGGGHPNRMVRLYHRSRRVYFRLLTGSWDYCIYASLRDVPSLVWSDPYLIVEKFLPERVGGEFAVRAYHFLGERDTFFLLTSPKPIVKSGPATRIHPLDPDPRLRALRRRLQLDYGKIDYVLFQGEPVILDVNKTVGLTEQFAHDPRLELARRERAQAIHDYLR
jgi:hypothetical protein